MKVPPLAALVASTLLAACVPAGAVTIRVPDDELTIQAGIDAASAGDTVLVACDIYYEHDIHMRSGVILMSETVHPACATIDAQGLGRALFGGSLEAGTRVEGFTITGGLATGSGSDDDGGAIRWTLSTLTIANCILSGNEATGGGGAIKAAPGCTLAIEDCTFSGNTAGYGGAIHSTSSDFSLTGCTFDGNTATTGQGALGLEAESRAFITSCLFIDNSGSASAGAIRVSNGSSITAIDCTFSGNSAESGGGINCTASSAVLSDCTFWDNTATDSGGALRATMDSSVSLVNCTLSSNAASWEGAGIYSHDSSADLTNCIVAFSTAGEAMRCDGTTDIVTLTCCDVYGNAGGDWVDCIAGQSGTNGNMSVDPLFCDDLTGDLTLCADSPCLPGGNGCGVLLGAHDAGCPPCDTPVEQTTWGAMKTLFR